MGDRKRQAFNYIITLNTVCFKPALLLPDTCSLKSRAAPESDGKFVVT